MLAVGSWAGVARAQIYFDRNDFLADNPFVDTLDFEGIAGDGETVQPAPAFPGIQVAGQSASTHTPTPDLTAVVDINAWDWGSGTPSDTLIVNSTRGYLMDISFDVPVRAVGVNVNIGVDIGDDGQEANVLVYDGAQLLADLTIPTSNDFSAFVGFSTVGDITEMIVRSPSQDYGHFVLIDDLSYGIPEPATLGLLALGGLAVLRRRSQTRRGGKK